MTDFDLSHVDSTKKPTMVDVTEKQVTFREATARCVLQIPDSLKARFVDGDFQSKKGPVFHTAIIAGTMAAKKTSDLIPFCHPISIESCKFNIEFNQSDIYIDCTVRVHHKTGVEMEALTGSCVAGLTIYDMCKAVSHDIVLKETRLLKKSGGKSDYEGS